VKTNLNDIRILIESLSDEEFYDMVMKAKGSEGSNKKCIYCMTDMNNEVFNKRDFSGQPWEIELMLNYRNQGNLLTIDLTTDENYEYVEIPINYCPFCGREL
jgi:hypothetical protein